MPSVISRPPAATIVSPSPPSSISKRNRCEAPDTLPRGYTARNSKGKTNNRHIELESNPYHELPQLELVVTPQPPFSLRLVLSILAELLKTPQQNAKELYRSKQLLLAARILDYEGYFLLDGKQTKKAKDQDILEVFETRILTIRENFTHLQKQV